MATTVDSRITGTALPLAVGRAAYALDLRADAPQPARAWRDGPARDRLIGPRFDPDLFLSGGSPRGYYDVVVVAKEVIGAGWLG